MKNMYKKLFGCIFILLNLQLMAQERPTVYLGAGLAFPAHTAGSQAYLDKAKSLRLGGYLPFLNQAKMSLGLNIDGSYSFSKQAEFKQIPEGFAVFGQQSNTVLPDQDNLKGDLFKIGLGPQLNFKAGKKISLSPGLQTGITMFSQKAFSFIQTFELGKEQYSKAIFSQDQVNSRNLYVAPSLKLSYAMLNNLGIWAESNYTFTKVKAQQRVLVPANPPREGSLYVIADVMEGSYRESGTASKWNAAGVQLGLSYSFGKERSKSLSAKANQAHQKADQVPGKTSAQKSGAIVFDNPVKKKQKDIRKLVPVLPKNNDSFQDAKSIKTFNWQWLGQSIQEARYLIVVTRISAKGQPQRTYTEKTNNTSIPALTLFKADQIAPGQYRWVVTEMTTGISSNPSFFSVSNCAIQFSIANENITCLGYEGANRKYKICFESTYSSSSGNLTYTNPGSGLAVYDQSYTPLTYTLVSPNTTLVSQPGASSTTQNYCFEVLVPSSVTSIGFGLQGDDLDPSPVLCQPGVSLVLDELPDCRCSDCEKMTVSFDNFNVTPNGSSGKQYNFTGNLQVNVPIYGIEFQVQSYGYTAAPNPCSNGVGSIEESGMILMPGTTINGSSTLQLNNETVSGSSTTNNNATKIVKYTSNTALSGAIPVNLNIGLPGPISGLNPGCCNIKYTVCIQVKVFYDPDNCKSCVFTHCFEFNNQ